MLQRRLLSPVALLMLLLLFGVGTSAAKVDLGGRYTLETQYLTQQQLVLLNQQYKLFLDGDVGSHGRYHLSLDGQTAQQNQQLSLAVGEVYVDAYLPAADLRIGNQVINWGTADGVNPTSDINPHNLSAPMEQGLGSHPVPAVQAAYYLPQGAAITGVVVLDFVPGVMPPGVALPVASGGPVGDGDQLELALRGEIPLRGRPVYLTYFRGWQDLPAAWLELPVGDVHSQYRRLESFGLATAITYGDAAIWFEGAYKKPESLPAMDQLTSVALVGNRPYVQLVAGADYVLPNGLYTSAQVLYNEDGSILSPYTQPGQERLAQAYVLLRGNYTVRDRHHWELTGLVNVTDGGLLLMPRYEYQIVDGIKMSLGVISVGGREGSELISLEPLVQGLVISVGMSF